MYNAGSLFLVNPLFHVHCWTRLLQRWTQEYSRRLYFKAFNIHLASLNAVAKGESICSLGKKREHDDVLYEFERITCSQASTPVGASRPAGCIVGRGVARTEIPKKHETLNRAERALDDLPEIGEGGELGRATWKRGHQLHQPATTFFQTDPSFLTIVSVLQTRAIILPSCSV